MHVSAAGTEGSSSGSGNGDGRSLGDMAGVTKQVSAHRSSSSRSNGSGAVPQNGNSEQRRIKWAQTSFKVNVASKEMDPQAPQMGTQQRCRAC